MYKKGVYWGCEMESPLYRKIVEENKRKKQSGTIVYEYKTKRGKQSK